MPCKAVCVINGDAKGTVFFDQAVSKLILLFFQTYFARP